MAFSQATVADVKDKLDEIQECFAKRAQATLMVGEGRVGLLTTEERDAVRTRLGQRIVALRTQIYNEVVTWGP